MGFTRKWGWKADKRWFNHEWTLIDTNGKKRICPRKTRKTTEGETGEVRGMAVRGIKRMVRNLIFEDLALVGQGTDEKYEKTQSYTKNPPSRNLRFAIYARWKMRAIWWSQGWSR